MSSRVYGISVSLAPLMIMLGCSQPYHVNVKGPPVYKDFSLSAKTQLRLQNSQGVWVVTKPQATPVKNSLDGWYRYGAGPGKIYFLDPNDPLQPVRKKWFFDQMGYGYGSRTYVTEAGLFFGRMPGHVFHVDSSQEENTEDTPLKPVWSATEGVSVKTPEGVLVMTYPYRTARADHATRACVSSFRLGEQPFLGIAWTADKELSSASQRSGQKTGIVPKRVRIFTRIPMGPQFKDGLDTAKQESVQLPAGGVTDQQMWGYSCFIDQDRQVLWSTWSRDAEVGDKIYGVDVARMRPVNLSDRAKGPRNFSISAHAKQGNPILAMPGMDFHFPQPSDKGSDLRTKAYAISGDSKGHLLAGGGVYTFANDEMSDTNFWHDSKGLHVASTECFSGNKLDCTPNMLNHMVFQQPETLGYGPLSSLQDGRIIKLQMKPNLDGKGTTDVVLISLKNPDCLQEGLEVKKLVQDLDGLAYVYTDFTGATLYSREKSRSVLNLADVSGYDPAGLNRFLSLKWHSSAGRDGEIFRNLILRARCIRAEDPEKERVPWVNVSPAVSGEWLQLAAPSCKEPALFDRLELELSLDQPGSYFTRLDQIEISLTQSQRTAEGTDKNF